MKTKDLEAFSQIIDEENTDNVFLYDLEEEPVEFEQIFTTPIGNRNFCILKPIVPMKEMEEDEALVFELIEKNGVGEVELVVDEGINDKVFENYHNLFNIKKKNKDFNKIDKFKKLLKNSFYRLLTCGIGLAICFTPILSFLNIDSSWITLIGFLVIVIPYWKQIFSFSIGNYKGALYSSVGWLKSDYVDIEIQEKNGHLTAIILTIIMFFLALFLFTIISIIVGIISFFCFFISLFGICIIKAKEATTKGQKALMIILAILLGLLILSSIIFLILDLSNSTIL